VSLVLQFDNVDTILLVCSTTTGTAAENIRMYCMHKVGHHLQQHIPSWETIMWFHVAFDSIVIKGPRFNCPTPIDVKQVGRSAFPLLLGRILINPIHGLLVHLVD